MLDGSTADRTAALTELLQNPETERIALYLPWNWLPTSSQPEYRETYVNTWWNLLEQVDQRADFMDGDIGERNDGQPRQLVTKAAHLAPMLLRASLITESDLEYIHDGTDSDTLRQSISDTRYSGTYAPLITTPATIHEQLSFVRRRSERSEDTPARRQWQYESVVRNLTRAAARKISFHDAEQLTNSEDPILTIIALRALARLGRRGHGASDNLLWMVHQTKHDDLAVQRQASTTLRHLHRAGFLPEGVLEQAGVTLPKLSGELSHNTQFIQEDINKLNVITEKLAHDPTLSSTYYPIVLVGGSRVKGYGDEHSDIDTTVIVRPNAQPADQALQELFGNDMPLQLPLEQTPEGLRIKDTDLTSDTWSHLVYSTLWVGESQTIDALRRDLTAAYDDPALRHGALRRLEQDSLQYRLMHKGYEHHYPVETDDFDLPSGGIDRSSVFWDTGYRELAAKLFVEKVRLPRVK